MKRNSFLAIIKCSQKANKTKLRLNLIRLGWNMFQNISKTLIGNGLVSSIII